MTTRISKSMIERGMVVEVNPRDDRSRKLVQIGSVEEVLTSSETHPHGILVRLDNGIVGRVKSIKGQAANLGNVLYEDRQEEALEGQGSIAEKLDIEEILKADEGPQLEFKSSALWSKNYTKEQIEKGSGDLQRYGQDTSKVIIAKTLASFLNSGGGVLVIGLKENKTDLSNDVIGIESEYKKLKDPCPDGYRRMILDFIIKPFFPSFIFHNFSKYFELYFEEEAEKTLCVIAVAKSDKKVFLRIKQEELFYIRIDASSRMIAGQDLVEYCMERF